MSLLPFLHVSVHTLPSSRSGLSGEIYLTKTWRGSKKGGSESSGCIVDRGWNTSFSASFGSSERCVTPYIDRSLKGTMNSRPWRRWRHACELFLRRLLLLSSSGRGRPRQALRPGAVKDEPRTQLQKRSLAKSSQWRVVGAWERAQVYAIQLHPRMGVVSECFDRQPDHELCRISLLTQQAIQD